MRKKELLILTSVIIALILYLFLQNRDQTHYDLPGLPEINGDEIDRIEIQTAGKILTVEKKKTGWIVGRTGYPADPEKVRDMLNALEDLTLSALISESGNYVRYDLEETKRISITAWNQEKRLREFAVGKAATTFQHTHILLAGDPKVYHARGDFRRIFDLEEESLQDKTVLDFRSDEIRELQIQSHNRSLTLKRTEVAGKEKKTEPGAGLEPPTEIVWVSPQRKRAEDSDVFELLRVLSGLRCEKYVDTGVEDASSEIALTLKGAEDHRLEIYSRKPGSEKNYFGKSSRVPFYFLLGNSQVDGIKEKINPIFVTSAIK